MAAVAWLVAHPEVPRAHTRIAFTVDEEVGRGVDHFDLEAFGADFAYTLDGSVVGEIENETWSAIELKVTFHGLGVHPGTAKGKLVNPVKAAARFVASLPPDRLSPETTEGREGFVHPTEIAGNAGAATVTLILRDFEWETLLEHEALVRQLAEEAIADEPRASVTYERWEQYRNMRDWLNEAPHVVEGALEAARRAGVAADAALDPRRHRRVAAHRDGPADAEHLRRRPGVPLAPRVGERAGHVRLRSDGDRAREAVGRARVAGPRRTPLARVHALPGRGGPWSPSPAVRRKMRSWHEVVTEMSQTSAGIVGSRGWWVAPPSIGWGTARKGHVRFREVCGVRARSESNGQPNAGASCAAIVSRDQRACTDAGPSRATLRAGKSGSADRARAARRTSRIGRPIRRGRGLRGRRRTTRGARSSYISSVSYTSTVPLPPFRIGQLCAFASASSRLAADTIE